MFFGQPWHFATENRIETVSKLGKRYSNGFAEDAHFYDVEAALAAFALANERLCFPYLSCQLSLCESSTPTCGTKLP
jgi:hypothetical protein